MKKAQQTPARADVEPRQSTPAIITVSETVTLTAPNRRLADSLYNVHYRADALTLDDVEEFVRIVRRELRPELVSIRADDHQIVASHSVQAL